jgi:DHA1 family tetracycline resistance protein-like MFS transporter
MTDQESRTSGGLDWKQLYPILLIIFTNILGAGVILPILPLYAEGQFGGTILQITLLSSVYFGAQFIAAPWLGRLADKYGRKPVLILSQMGTVLAFTLFIFAGPLGTLIDGLGPGLPLTGGLLMLFVARGLDGITGGNITTAQAYVSDISTEEERAQALGMLQAAFGAGFIFGPAFGGVLANYGPVIPFIGAAIITTGTLLLTTFTLKESLPPEGRSAEPAERRSGIPFNEIIAMRGLVLLLVVGFFGSLAFSAVPSTFALYADKVLFASAPDPQRAQLYIGLMLTFNGLMQVVTQIGLLKPLIQRLGERRLLLVGELAIIASFLGVAPATSAIVVTALFAPFAFGRGVSEPSLQSLVTRFGSERTHGQLLGLYQSSRSLALIIGPIWAGITFQTISPQAVFLVGSGIMSIAFLFALMLQHAEIPSIGSARGHGR